MNTDIPANADPGYTPSVNHLGPTIGILTDPATADWPIKFFGNNQNFSFNFYVGALYSAADSGVGLGLGWHGFMIDLSTSAVTEIPLRIKRDTLIFETSAASLGNPVAFDWAAASECDPVAVPEEKRKAALLVDYAPGNGYASWPGQKP
jgi:hypothetical protein